MVSRVALCSVFCVIRCLPRVLLNCAAPLMARLLPSVAPEVHTISFGSAPIRAATWPRASSTACSAAQPNECERLAGLPKCSVRYGIIFCATRGSTGVVAE